MKTGRVYKYYTKVVVEDLLYIYNYNNIMEFMQLYRIILSTTSQRFLSEKKSMIDALVALIVLFGQRGVYTRARKSIAGFSVRENNIIGCMTTLRRQKMYTFLDRMVAFAFGLHEFTELIDETRNSEQKNDKTRSFDFATAKFAVEPLLPNDRIRSQLINDNLLSTNIGSVCQSRTSSRLPSFSSWYTSIPDCNPRLSCISTGFNNKMHLKGGLRLSTDVTNFTTKTQATLSTMPEVEHLFSVFDSIKGLNTVYSLVVPSTYSSKPINRQCNPNRHVRLCLPFQESVKVDTSCFKRSVFGSPNSSTRAANLKQSILSFKHNGCLLEFTNSTNSVEQTINPRADLVVCFLPKQRPSLLFTAFQLPKTLASAL